MKDNYMFETTIDFANLLLASLVVGTMFGIWLSQNPTEFGATVYVLQQQHAIRALNVAMPVLGGATALLTIVAAVLARNDRPRLFLLIAVVVCFVVAGMITRLLNQPINAIVMTWSADAAPANWMQLRDDWWRWHVIRTSAAMIGLCLLIAATLKRACSC